MKKMKLKNLKYELKYYVEVLYENNLKLYTQKNKFYLPSKILIKIKLKAYK